MNITIMRAFVEIRRILLQQDDIREQLFNKRLQPLGYELAMNYLYLT
jgi:hypothetical protein